MALPAIQYVNSHNSSSPIPVKQFGLSVSVVMTTKDARVQITDPATGSLVDQRVSLVAGTQYSGQLVIKGLQNNVHRAATNAIANPLYPAGMYLESEQSQVGAQLVFPYSIVQQRIRDGGVLRVYAASAVAHTGFATGAILFKNGVQQAGTVVTVPANDGAIWGVFEPAAVPTEI